VNINSLVSYQESWLLAKLRDRPSPPWSCHSQGPEPAGLVWGLALFYTHPSAETGQNMRTAQPNAQGHISWVPVRSIPCSERISQILPCLLLLAQVRKGRGEGRSQGLFSRDRPSPLHPSQLWLSLLGRFAQPHQWQNAKPKPLPEATQGSRPSFPSSAVFASNVGNWGIRWQAQGGKFAIPIAPQPYLKLGSTNRRKKAMKLRWKGVMKKEPSP